MVSLQIEKRLLQKTSEELMRTYSGQNPVVGRSVGKLMKSVASSFLGMVLCISRAVLKRCLKEVFAMNHFTDELHRNCIEHSQRYFRGSIAIDVREHVVLLNQFVLIEVSIYEQLFTS